MGIREDGDSFLLLNDEHLYVQLDDNGTVSAAKLGHCGSVLAPASLDIECVHGLHRGTDSICFVPYENTQSYCLRVGAPHCLSNASAKENVYFYPIDEVLYVSPRSPSSMEVTGRRECEAICLSNCSCTSYAFHLEGTCSLWFWELRKVVTTYVEGSYRLYVRMPKQEKLNPWIGIIVLIVIGVLTLMLVGLVLWWRSKRKLFIKRLVNSSNGLTIFSNVQIKKATRNFSDKLGEGGFCCVFFFERSAGFSRGYCQEPLLSLSKAKRPCTGGEAIPSGSADHWNDSTHQSCLFIGYCAEGSKWLLVYEYMENGSLNSHLFSKSLKLIWEIRYRIAVGTARGFAYLHEECKDCIIHCDMKPDNVLLDADFCPKIADFGMAKLIGRDFSRALTTMRGAIGYLAPEWISGLPITRKSDVYSYGLVLLEIISGRRNSEKIKEGKFLPTFPSSLH